MPVEQELSLLQEIIPRTSNQSILKEISPEYSLEGLMLKLKLQYFGQLIWRVNSLERPWYWEGLGAGGEEGNRGWDGWMASPTRRTWVWANPRVGDGQGGLECCDSWGHKESDTTEQLNWTDSNNNFWNISLSGMLRVIYLGTVEEWVSNSWIKK